MPDLVSLADLKTYLGDAPASSDDGLLTDLLDSVEAMLERASGREVGAFREAEDERTEVLDGTGSCDLYLEYPIRTVASIKLGFNVSSPVETLDPADKTVIVYGAGSRRISRVDGGTFGRVGSPRYVQVVYASRDDIPDDARLAVMSVCARAYRRRGSEEAKSETTGAYSLTSLAEAAIADDPFWAAAVGNNTRLSLA
jgi:hypothetical protein